MHIKLECPRCKQALAVPKKKAGSYVQCPRCKGSLWVGENLAQSPDGDLPDGSVMAETVTAAPGGAGALPGGPAGPGRAASIPLPPSLEAGPASGVLPPSASPPPPPPGGSGTMPVVAIPRPAGVGSVTKFRAAAPPLPPGGVLATTGAAPPPAARKTARFITAEAAQSAIKIAADGKLPELHLQEGDKKNASDTQGKAINPLLLLVALFLSVAMSMALVLMDFGSDNQVSARQANARQDIAEKYFSDLDPNKPLERYQVLLREAQEAYCRHDRAAEMGRYHRVLDMLHREHGAFDKGLTGSPSRDKELEEQLTILLGG